MWLFPFSNTIHRSPSCAGALGHANKNKRPKELLKNSEEWKEVAGLDHTIKWFADVRSVFLLVLASFVLIFILSCGWDNADRAAAWEVAFRKHNESTKLCHGNRYDSDSCVLLFDGIQYFAAENSATHLERPQAVQQWLAVARRKWLLLTTWPF